MFRKVRLALFIPVVLCVSGPQAQARAPSNWKTRAELGDTHFTSEGVLYGIGRSYHGGRRDMNEALEQAKNFARQRLLLHHNKHSSSHDFGPVTFEASFSDIDHLWVLASCEGPCIHALERAAKAPKTARGSPRTSKGIKREAEAYLSLFPPLRIVSAMTVPDVKQVLDALRRQGQPFGLFSDSPDAIPLSIALTAEDRGVYRIRLKAPNLQHSSVFGSRRGFAEAESEALFAVVMLGCGPKCETTPLLRLGTDAERRHADLET
ncbi:MAG: hypothetical protein AAFQ82_16285 [Myxococcota bacterium]